MYPGKYAAAHPDRAAFIMASTGETVTYPSYEQRSNRLAHLLRAEGLKRLDHYAIFMENNSRYLECDAAGERAGLYYTCINSYLTRRGAGLHRRQQRVAGADHLARQAAGGARRRCANARASSAAWWSMAAAPCARSAIALRRLRRGHAALSRHADRRRMAGHADAVFVGHHRAAQGHPAPAAREPAVAAAAAVPLPAQAVAMRDGMVYLSPAPLYHSAPQANVALAIRNGGTVVIMEHFDPEQYLALIEQYRVTHSQLVPTMFSRMLKLPADVRKRYDLSSLKIAIHAAAPCPVQVKEQMIEWWGPIIHEYYGATEGLGFTACDSAEWLAHRGTVGKVMLGDLHVLDENMQPAPKGSPASSGSRPPRRSSTSTTPSARRQTRSADGTMTHGGRRRLRRRRRLPVPDRPLDLHDHLGRRQHLPAGVREPADHAPARWPTRRCSACPTKTSAKRSRRWCSRCPA